MEATRKKQTRWLPLRFPAGRTVATLVESCCCGSHAEPCVNAASNKHASNVKQIRVSNCYHITCHLTLRTTTTVPSIAVRSNKLKPQATATAADRPRAQLATPSRQCPGRVRKATHIALLLSDRNLIQVLDPSFEMCLYNIDTYIYIYIYTL